MWSHKYKPNNFDEIIGNQSIKENIRKYKWDKPLILYGAIGVGKTIFAKSICTEFKWDLVEINEDNINSARQIAITRTLSGRKKLILVDNVEKIKNIKLINEIIKETKNPMILITAEFKDKRIATTKKYCEKLQIRRPQKMVIAKILQVICKKEGIVADMEILSKIAENTGGDVRAAINDLETVGCSREKITMDDLKLLSPRDTTTDITSAMEKIFKSSDLESAVRVMWDLNEMPRDVLPWIDELLPKIYNNKEIVVGYYYLSRSDIFIRRIQKQQYWGFLRYASPLMSGGVALAKEGQIKQFNFFGQFPQYWAKMGRTKKERGLKDSIGEKLHILHVSKKVGAREFIPLFKVLLKRGKLTDAELEAKFKFNYDEIEYLKN